MRVFRRRAVAAVRVEPSAGQPAQLLRVVPIDLYCFFGIDVSLLNVEVEANGLLPSRAQELHANRAAAGCQAAAALARPETAVPLWPRLRARLLRRVCAGFAPGLRLVGFTRFGRACAPG